LNEKTMIIACPDADPPHKLRLPKRNEIVRVSCPICGMRFRYRFPDVVEILGKRDGVLSVASSYSQQPEEKLITMSRINSSSCLYRYFKEYIEDPRVQEPFKTIEQGMGSFFHSYLENHFKQILARNGVIGTKDSIDVDDLANSFRLSFLWEGQLRKPYRIVQRGHSVKEFIARLERIGRNYNCFLQENLVYHKIKSIEGSLQIRTDPFYIRGKYDLITEDPHKSIVLWDWKTSAAPDPAYYEQFRSQKIQLGIYAIWMRHRYKSPLIRGTAVFLRGELDELSEKFTDSVEKDVLDYTHSWRRRLNQQQSYPAMPNKLGPWCGWNPICPKRHSCAS